MSPATTIPPEIWHYIFRLACVDGGYTGRSLALTSTFFHTQSLLTRFHSLAFTSLDCMTKFVDFLQHQPPDFRPRIKHLCIRLTHAVSPRRALLCDTTHQLHGILAATLGRLSANVIVDVLRAAGPTVQTLCIVVHGEARSLPICLSHDMSFPNLQELCWMGSAIPFILDTDEAHVAIGSEEPPPRQHPATFPVLQRVHYVSTSYHAEDIIPSSASRCMYAPNAPDVFARALGVYIPNLADITAGGHSNGVSDASASAAVGEPSLPGLSRFILHLFQPGLGGWGMFDDSRSLRLLMRLAQLAGACQRETEGIPLLQLVAAQPTQHWPGILQKDWEARMEGETGCWVTPEPEENAPEDDEDDRFSTTAQIGRRWWR